jgi:segregation and condensation protein A
VETQSRTENYVIKTSVFEGPFALLLDLIEKKKLFINDISLAQVTEDYLAYLKGLGSLHPTQISNFVVVASTLLLIKSKSLLPTLTLTEEEEGSIRSLEERLRLYEMFTRLSQNIQNIFGKKIIFPAEERRRGIVVFLPDEHITRESMMVCVKDVLGAIPKATFVPEVEVRKVVSIEEMIGNLTERVQRAMKMSFKEFTGKGGTKEEKVFVIVGF